MTQAEQDAKDAARWRRLIEYKGPDGWLVLTMGTPDTPILIGDHANAAMDEEMANDLIGLGLTTLRTDD